MGVEFPGPDAIRDVLVLANRAPSVHNSQPWHWRVGPDSLHLYADPSRHLPRIDPDRRDMMLSCGAALHHCTVALAAAGWRATVDRLPDPSDPHHLAVITVTAQPPGELDVTLAAAITRRRTDRRTYGSWPVPWGDIALMGARAARAGVMLRQVDEIPALNAIVAESVARHSNDPDYLAELTAWSGRHGSVAGVPARNTPDPDEAAPIPARVFAGPALRQPSQAPSSADNAAMLVLGTEGDDELARLRAGEVTSLVLLSATAMGLASCPVTEPLEIAETRASVREDVFGASGYPQMIVRVGWSPVGADPLPATPRRPLNEVADWLHSGASNVGPDVVSRVC
ncbi:MAG TPA: NAD(P)H nitroreductase [Mycobacterium sp.]|uniref:Acg family FMN-binding oxidoreductase n=1 Tax=Mycolicibacterium sp. TaxID=2320850 RepID=UPI0025CEC3BD|nr:NAD(P)H nitroreductase [Mycolicibacterium sp.]HPX36875.1 NAD(P)H nitroreductase [Mycobacterium sp.]HQC76255.1 NAD(P)H nitroreductase [Mycobacterium sp.]